MLDPKRLLRMARGLPRYEDGTVTDAGGNARAGVPADTDVPPPYSAQVGPTPMDDESSAEQVPAGPSAPTPQQQAQLDAAQRAALLARGIRPSQPAPSSQQLGGIDVPMQGQSPQAPPADPNVAVPPPQTTLEQRQAAKAQAITSQITVPGAQPTQDDIDFGKMVAADPDLQAGMDLALKQKDLKDQVAHQQSDAFDQYQAQLTKNDADAQKEMQAEVRARKAYYDNLTQLTQQAAATVPSPDRLPGMEPGSWSRAITIALAGAASGMGAPTLANIIRDQISVGMAGQAAEHNQALAQLQGANISEQARAGIHQATMAGFDLSKAAAMDAFSTKLQSIALKMQPGQDAIELQNTALMLKAQVAKQKMDAAKSQMDMLKEQSEIEKNEAEAAKAGRGGAGGETSGGNPYGAKGLYISETGKYIQGGSPERVKDDQTALDNSENALKQIDEIEAAQANDPGFRRRMENKIATDADSATLQAQMQALQFKLEKALGGGELSNRNAELMKKLGADPGAVSEIWPQFRAELKATRQSLLSSRNTIKERYGVKDQYPEAPQQLNLSEATKAQQDQLQGDVDDAKAALQDAMKALTKDPNDRKAQVRVSRAQTTLTEAVRKLQYAQAHWDSESDGSSGEDQHTGYQVGDK